MDRTAPKNSPYIQPAVLIRKWESTAAAHCVLFFSVCNVIFIILFLSLKTYWLEEEDMASILSQARLFFF